jgi:hypothetical protein
VRDRSFSSALATIVAASAAPYGYTISVWSSGAVLIHTHGVPTVGEVFAFLGGALCGYGTIALLARDAVGAAPQVDDASDRVLAGALHWLAAGGAVGSVALIAEIGGWEAWPLASFALTCVYLLGASVQLAFVAGR